MSIFDKKVHFPNGFSNWTETHFEVVTAIILSLETDGSRANRMQEIGGRGSLWALATGLTNEFEKLHEGRVWDGEFYDEIDKFLDEQLSQK